MRFVLELVSTSAMRVVPRSAHQTALRLCLGACEMASTMPRTSSAATISADNAGNYSQGNVATGTNSGTNFGAWNIVAGSNLGNPLFVVSGTEAGHSGLAGTSAWAMNATSGNGGSNSIALVARPFASGGLVAGQTFSMDLDANSSDSVFEISLAMKSTGSSYQAFNVLDAGAIDFEAHGGVDTGISLTTPVHASFRLNGNGTVTTQVSPLPSGSIFSTTTQSVGFTPDNMLFEYDAVSGTLDHTQDLLINNLTVSTPEPGILGLSGCVIVAALLRRRFPHRATQNG